MLSNTQETSSLQHYLHVLRRRKWIILQAVVICTLAAVVYSLHQTHLYRATAQVWLNNKDLTALVTGGVGNIYSSPDRVAATNADLARTPTVAAGALKRAHVTDRTAGDFLANSSVEPEPNADLLDFSVTDHLPGLATRLATAYGQEFIRFRHKLDTQSLTNAEASIRTQIKELESIGDTHSPRYLTLVQKLQQLQAVEALLTPPILTRPATSSTKVQPRPLQYALLGFILGLGLGVALAFLRDALDTRVRTAEEIGERLGLPLLARLPEPPAKLRSENKLAMLEAPGSVAAEAFRVLRTNLDFVNLDRRAQIIMVTSAIETEGKSTTIANLAVAYARAGRRVIAVDLDLRRPNLDKLMGFGKRPGVTQVAIGQLALEDALVPIAVSDPRSRSLEAGLIEGPQVDAQGSLEILPSGPVPPDVGEFVGSRMLTEIFEQLRHLADIVLVDSPPLLRVGDSITLSGKVDGLIVVSNLAHAKRPMIVELRRVLDACPGDKLGFVITGATSMQSGYGYGYGYGYGANGDYYTRPPERREREAIS